MKLNPAIGVAICVLCVLTLQGCVGVIAAGAIAGMTMAQDRRSPGTYIDDELIELTILTAMSKDEDVWNQSHINVTSFNGLVLLTGEALDESLQKRIIEIARNTPKVRGVHNEIVRAAPSSLISRSGDTWITTKVKTTLLNEEQFNATHIKVITENDVVYLMGLLKRDEAERAAEIARRIRGVQRVSKIMEYVD